MAYGNTEKEGDVEGHLFKVRCRDEQGQEREIPGDRIRNLAWRDASGEEHEVEGHVYRARGLEQEPDVEGHGYKFKFRDEQGNEHEASEPFRVTYLDDQGQEQEVEGHLVRVSDRRLKRDVSPLGGTLARLRALG